MRRLLLASAGKFVLFIIAIIFFRERYLMNSEQQTTDESVQFNQLFHSGTVRARKTVRDWQEAVHLSGQLLVDNGSVEPAYVDAMERVLRELGPYAVIAPGIVLLHARPEDGVLEPCMGLVTLSTPVRFGHSQNDPVDIVIALGAVDKKGHIQALQRLAGLLGDPDGLTRLRSASTDDVLLSVIQSWAGQS
jgi:mannitol/fructose-specific phosphotransferase system IIA component (Ntr-type)